MDEAENLADNLLIMKDGRFLTYGSLQYVKSVYSKGIYIDIMFKNPVEMIKELLLDCPQKQL